jgi:hypothetical protein
VVDLRGLSIPQQVPILLSHDRDKRVGYSESINVENGELVIRGRLLSSEFGRDIALDADEGFPFQASIGFRINDVEVLDDGDGRTVNGREFDGPVSVITSAQLLESSFVPLGADSNTSARVYAEHDDDYVEVTMSESEDVEVKDEVEVGARSAGAATITELKALFPDRAEFVIDQFERGASLLEAKAAYSDVLATELSAEKSAHEEAKRLLTLSQETGVAFTPAEERAEPVAVELSLEDSCKRVWKESAAVRAEFPDFDVFHAYKRAEADGSARIL